MFFFLFFLCLRWDAAERGVSGSAVAGPGTAAVGFHRDGCREGRSSALRHSAQAGGRGRTGVAARSCMLWSPVVSCCDPW